MGKDEPPLGIMSWWGFLLSGIEPPTYKDVPCIAGRRQRYLLHILSISFHFLMPDLAYRQQKIQEKRKQTSFRDFVREMASWVSLNFYRNYGRISRYPMTERIGTLSPSEQFYEQANHITGPEPTGDFWKDYQQLFHVTTLPLLLG